nr:hypothetical protein [Afifella pfennigii]
MALVISGPGAHFHQPAPTHAVHGATDGALVETRELADLPRRDPRLAAEQRHDAQIGDADAEARPIIGGGHAGDLVADIDEMDRRVAVEIESLLRPPGYCAIALGSDMRPGGHACSHAASPVLADDPNTTE